MLTSPYGVPVSPRLSLPRFKLVPRVQGEGMLVQLANSAITSTQPQPRTPTPHAPAFEQRYYLFGTDADAVRSVLTTARMQALARMETPWEIEAGGAVLVYEPWPQVDPRAKRPKLTPDEQVQVYLAAARLWKLFAAA